MATRRSRRTPGAAAAPRPEELSLATLEWVTALKERRLAAMAAAAGGAGAGMRRPG
jgi:hypothetical protein